jgi:putative FmdB family regulatory protein
MAGYVYRCGECGPWEIQRPIGTADSTSSCPVCGATGRRLYTAPLVSRLPQAVATARLQEEASRDAPAVTTSVPRAVGRPARRDPRWSTLPRP